jgi:hypothetical protein
VLQPLVKILAAVCLLIAAQPAGQAETPEEVQQRLELYRQVEAQRERQRQDTLEWQERRRAEDYARKWKRYGADEVNVLSWMRQADGSWVADAKLNIKPERNRSASLDRVLPSGSTAPLAPVLPADQPQLPMRPNLDQLGGVAPRRFDQSLDELVRVWVVSPMERTRIEGEIGAMQPLDVGDHQRACRTEALSSQECRSGVAIRWGALGRAERPISSQSTPSSAEQIAVNCASLMVNRKVAFMDWGKWSRPESGSPHEQLVIDRCATQSHAADGR